MAAIAAAFVIWREGRNQKLDEEKLIDLLLFVAVFGLVGARIYYLIFHFGDFGFSPFRWLLFFHFPGLSFLGALLGGVAGAFFFCRRNGWSFWQVGDILVLGVALGEAIGRVGAFLSGSAYGAVTSLPWGVPMIGLLGRRHPTQLYEFLAALLTFILLLKFKNHRFLIYFLLFGSVRFFLEFLRGDSVYFYGWRTTQLVCLVFILLSVVFLYRRSGRSPKADLFLAVEKIKNFRKKGNNDVQVPN